LEKEHFLFLVENYTNLTQEEAVELTLLQEHFPYSQIVRNLAARASQDNAMDSREHLLHMSAICTTDRAVLKSIMTAPRSERMPVALPGAVEKNYPVTEPKAPAKEKEIVSGVSILRPEISLFGEALRKDILLELKKLKVSKHNFEVSVEKYEQLHSSPVQVQKKERKKPQKNPVHPDLLIEEIKTTKKKVVPEGKQKEQIEIIENFIKTKPSIAKNKGNLPKDNSDLAEKSLMYGDNIVSETLVEILLKQGKKDKAIEVLKKLIWKFPQKKAYFAAQIEELKK
jgi:hypothetical protein